MSEGPARLVGIYGGTCFLVYLETGSFTKTTSSSLFGIPLLVLSFLSLTSAMQPKAKITTAAAFATLALSRYMLVSRSSWECMVIGYAMVVLGNMIYFYSFMSLIEEWSIALAALGTMFYFTVAYYCFADTYSSIPFLIFLHGLAFASSCFLVVAAGSTSQNDTDEETVQASYIRLCGALGNVASNTMFLISLFGNRVETLQIFSRCLFYLAQGLMFFANERTF